ncbi:hypothetical protein BDN72DRAFT_761413 [Pluteus cervinus]|uniref:Uncharacterized protein n=1 Tax=Pluteus cervinus TaxID=181527 RepID=A0ACD3B7K7_9AGAR|nr:hypothetical protein BDN72DRAFT_761413 [Pluteus cervinus]
MSIRSSLKNTRLTASDIAEAPTPSPRLSAVIDPSVFIARPITPSAILDESISMSPNTSKEHSCDSLNSSPLHVEPYPQRPASGLRSPLDTPTQRKIEGVYDRFLMATSGVKRLGKGYQSDYAGPVGHTVLKKPAHHSALPRPFQTNRRPMPPPVSSEDCQRRGLSVDELGILTYSNSNSSREGAKTPSGKEDGTGTTITLMKRAMKAFVPAKTTSKRVSRAVAA